MARRILLSQEDLNAVVMQDSTLEGHNTLAGRVRGEIFKGIVESDCVHAYVVRSFKFAREISCVA